MKVYPWDESTNEALLPVVKPDNHPNPIGRSETATPVPENIPAGYAARAALTAEGWFRGWEVVIDKRGDAYWTQDGIKNSVSELGNDIPDGSLTEPPPTHFHRTHDGASWLLDLPLLSAARRKERDGKLLAIYAPASQQLSRWIDEAEDDSAAFAFYKSQRSVWHVWADALCDLPDQSGFPWADGDVPWPEQPPSPMRYATKPE
ncbi:hypothetical protein [Desulfoluna butyratoxydans]|uniref:Uncharacterized protein n=1 Tax=Desulfoluna butyratoxydans TaxID=231438 RepID=A0A4U8YTP3_9BACT|nr:hypothetical protein [Desulfoluna butyratoxydans]VFQ46927.1 hypothetical protein MSL71_46090 [Desulfoluna butyratoxydans]